MQKHNRGTMASLTPQFGLQRPSNTYDLQGSARKTAQHAGEGGQGAPPANPKLLDGLGKPILGRQGGYCHSHCASIIFLHALIMIYCAFIHEKLVLKVVI